jgi:23S rRNA (adenine2503-C2)-methyltransferase
LNVSSPTQPEALRAPLSRLPEEWAERLRSWGEPAYRAGQVFRWLHQRGVHDPALMTDLSKGLRDKLVEEGVRPALALTTDHRSSDGTRKLLVELHDGRRVETVLIPQASVAARDVYAPPEDEPGESLPSRVTQCISSQVGCAMGCGFCASGIAGLKRHMDAGEIASQVLLGKSLLEDGQRLAGVVFMGMGEPLHNYAEVSRALQLLTHREGLGLSARRITLSTSGLVPEIGRLARDFGGRIRLAVSLHASDNDTRGKIMPINRKYPLPELLAALRAYPQDAYHRITIEYTLIEDVNDSEAAARRLVGLLEGLQVKVNLIPMNPVQDAGLRMPDPGRVDRFREVLRRAGVDAFVRKQRGDDIAAACGQLALQGEGRKVRLLPISRGGLVPPSTDR